MAINSIGYRGWDGKLAPAWTRPVVIAKTGIIRAWQSRWLRRLLLFAWMPAIWFGAGFFLFEKSVEYPQYAEPLSVYLRQNSNSPEIAQVVEQAMSGNPAEARHGVWGWLILSFLRAPQSVLMVMLVGLIAPPLISQDIRSRAFLLYFSRPLGRAEYVLGKLGTVWAYLSMISAVPALALYVMGVLLSPDAGVIVSTWDLPLRSLVAASVMSIPTATLALCISSLTQESRTAAFAWFSIWIVGWVTFAILSTVETLHGVGADSIVNQIVISNPWSHVSMYHLLGQVQSWVFGFRSFGDVWLSASILATITVVSLAIMLRQVTAPMRA